MSEASNSSWRREMEARITSLLLGELSPTEATMTRLAIEEDPELAKLQAHLEQTFSLVRTAVKTPVPAPARAPAPPVLQLSADKRDRLLASLKPAPAPVVALPLLPVPRRPQFLRECLAIAAMILALLLPVALLIPKTDEALPLAGQSPDELSVTDFAAAAPRSDVQGIAASKPVDLPTRRSRAVGEKDQAVENEILLRQPAGGEAPKPEESVENRFGRAAIVGVDPSSQPPVQFFRGTTSASTSALTQPDPSLNFATLGDHIGEVGEKSVQPIDKKIKQEWHISDGQSVPGFPVLIQKSVQEMDQARSSQRNAPLSESLQTQAADSRADPAPAMTPPPANQPSDFRNSAGSVLLGDGDSRPLREDSLSKRQFDRGALTPPHLPEEKRNQRLSRTEKISGSGTASDSSPPSQDPAPAGPAIDPAGRRSGGLAGKETPPPPQPQPEKQTASDPFSTFSMNVSDVSFQLAIAALEAGTLPDPSSIRSEEFINAFDYRDPQPTGNLPVAFAWERAHSPFAHQRDLLRFSVKTAAAGRSAQQPLNLVLLLDNSGSMERADRLQIVRECMQVLVTQLQPADRVSVVAFARTPRLWIDGLRGAEAGQLLQRISELTPEGGTNLEEALRLAYETAHRHRSPNANNRVVLLTDGAANLGNIHPASLQQRVQIERQRGIALDCFGIGWEGYNDSLLALLSSHGDGRYGFLNTPQAAQSDFAARLAGALQVAASDLKVQVEFNPRRVIAHRQVGYAQHQLSKEQFRDNTVDAAEIGAAESGTALYMAEVNPAGDGPIATVRVRFRQSGQSLPQEHEWVVPYTGTSPSLDRSSPAMRVAAVAGVFSEWLAGNPFSEGVTTAQLLAQLGSSPEAYAGDQRPEKLAWMIRRAGSLAGK